MGLTGILLLSSPVLPTLIHFPSGEEFSELYLLGPNQMAADLPFNIKSGQNYTVYLGVGNHLDSLGYYVCYVKLCNQTDSQPDEKTSISNPKDILYEYRFAIQNNLTMIAPLNFALNNISISRNQSFLETLTINDRTINVNKLAQFDQHNNGYFYEILIELWVFSPSTDAIQYQHRYVDFWVNVTSA